MNHPTHLVKRYAPTDSVAHVMRRTGCSEQDAVAELIAEEGDIGDAVLHINGVAKDDQRLLPRADWQTQARGTNDQEYRIYADNAEALGWKVKSYEEWLAS
ncbi:hypothetical protein [Paraburkholderia sp. C35]|uniref:hypothetical protein n=1 Tax=Paraburkholderia sp. C35 TaxID=2126993 RepID=UPI000D698259|nr:hypothetical protein [Paraburkholderia sp. C35]